MRSPRMLPAFIIATSAAASARMASANRSPRFVSPARRRTLLPSSGTGRADDRLERGAEPRFVLVDDRRSPGLVRERVGDRDELVEALHRALHPIDIDARNPFRIAARLADERAVFRARDRVVLVPADDQIDVRQ